MDNPPVSLMKFSIVVMGSTTQAVKTIVWYILYVRRTLPKSEKNLSDVKFGLDET